MTLSMAMEKKMVVVNIVYICQCRELKASAEPTDHKRAAAFLPLGRLAPAQQLCVENILDAEQFEETHDKFSVFFFNPD